MRIGILGTRGVPARYGGFEACAEAVAVGLVERGHEVTAYCRRGNVEGDPLEYKGVTLRYKRHLESKVTGTLTHTALSMVDALRSDFDVLLVFNAANAPLCLVSRLFRKPTAINVDGLEWKRRKWGTVGKAYYQFVEWLSPRLTNRVISDAVGIQDYYLERYKRPSTYIAYGAEFEVSERPEILAEYGLEPGEYFFVGSRLEPENNGDTTIAAFAQVKTTKRLAIAGGANWDSPYVRSLHETIDDRVKLLGPVYAEGHMRELRTNSFAYVHGNEVGGTGPALLEALAAGTCVMALDVNFNLEVIGDAGIFYRKDPADLAAKMQAIVDDPSLTDPYRERGPRRIAEAYQWPVIVEQYEQLLERLVAGYYRPDTAAD